MREAIGLTCVRPLVRYVDDEQAIIDIQVRVQPSSFEGEPDPAIWNNPELQARVFVTIDGHDGYTDEQQWTFPLAERQTRQRLHIVQPQRWWPAGMGEQTLYDLTISLSVQDELIAQRKTTLGLTSVRLADGQLERRLLVNGRECRYSAVIPVDLADERHLLPAAGDSLLLVRGHYGPDVLYDAADRAGILLIQCVPLHPLARPESDVGVQVDRLASHPSLAGWYVGHLGGLADRVARTLRELDPTHPVLRHVA